METLQVKGLSASTVKTDLAAIRFFHGQIPNVKHRLPNNKTLMLQRRKFDGVDRTWSGAEFNRMLLRAMLQNRDGYAAVLCLARYSALRLHECFRIDTATADRALNTGILTIKGKGGLVRDIPINESIVIVLKNQLAVTPRGQKLFVAPEDKIHLAMHRLESFIHYYKDEVQDVDSTRPMTFHGLRHSCAEEWYKRFLAEGLSEYEARKKVAKLLGRGRDDVTSIYLASLFGGKSATF